MLSTFRRTLTSLARRRFTSSSFVCSYPDHSVVAMPALSPTMASGTIGKWLMKEGDKVNPGDSMADIETDKASMAFEAQDEFYIAKIIVAEGKEVDVGVPIMVTVEDESDIAAFANFEAAAPAAASAPEVTTPVPPVTTPITTPTVPASASSPGPVPIPAPAPAFTNTVISANSVLRPNSMKPRFQSPLAEKIQADQQAYIERFGRTGHKPLTSTA